MKQSAIPEKSYGILHQTSHSSAIDQAVEMISQLGYAVVDSGLDNDQICKMSEAFDLAQKDYIQRFGFDRLRLIQEHNTIRAPLISDSRAVAGQFLKLAMSANLMLVLSRLIAGKFILNQQNCIINPPQEGYNQGAWHRDLPYQHFVSSRPLAVNALFCLDDFTFENGATFVLPASHRDEPLPSQSYIQSNAVQVAAKAGSFIVLDCMIFHAGGMNTTQNARRAINHVYTIPYFKQQINLPASLSHLDLTEAEKDLLGFGYLEPLSIADYLSVRTKK